MKTYVVKYYSRGRNFKTTIKSIKDKSEALSLWLSSMYGSGYQHDIKVESIRRVNQ